MSPQPQAIANGGVIQHITTRLQTMTPAFSPSAAPEAIKKPVSTAGCEKHLDGPHRHFKM